MNNERELNENVNAFDERDLDLQLLEQSLQMAQSEQAQRILEELVNNPSVDLQYFAKRAITELAR